MRLIKEIPHERYRISIHNYNEKYLIKIELGQFEQTFKISEIDVQSLEDLERMVTSTLLSNCLHRFVQMREDWENAFNQKNITYE
ncbi:MAG: hypothetical protein FJX84_01755 [Bacteroidetes bacterium]|nr:hypothetical protein [Bacteroidota bacterium]